MELEFLENLDKISHDQEDKEMFEKPLIFRAHFTSHKDFIVERETMSKEHASKLLSHKVDLKMS